MARIGAFVDPLHQPRLAVRHLRTIERDGVAGVGQKGTPGTRGRRDFKPDARVCHWCHQQKHRYGCNVVSVVWLFLVDVDGACAVFVGGSHTVVLSVGLLHFFPPQPIAIGPDAFQGTRLSRWNVGSRGSIGGSVALERCTVFCGNEGEIDNDGVERGVDVYGQGKRVADGVEM